MSTQRYFKNLSPFRIPTDETINIAPDSFHGTDAWKLEGAHNKRVIRVIDQTKFAVWYQNATNPVAQDKNQTSNKYAASFNIFQSHGKM
jgi:hypothetical protein